MQAYRNIEVSRTAAVHWIRLHRPAQMNAIDPEMVEEMLDALNRSSLEPRCRVLVLTGSGKSFCAGADLNALPGTGTAGGSGPDSLRTFLLRMKELCDSLDSFKAPTIALVNGLACAGGLELMLCCDIVLAAEDARIGDMHANFGLLPGAGASVRLPRRIGAGAAKFLMYTGELWSAAEMHRLGLVQRILPSASAESETAALADVIARKSPLANRRLKTLVRQGSELPEDQALRAEIESLVQHSMSHDMAEGLRAFADRKAPEFTGA